jgi:hypothetical protein
MLCDTCKNKRICKHYEYFNNITVNIDIQINNCELYSNKNTSSIHTEERPIYRQPLPSTYVDPEENTALSDEEDEERVYIDMNSLDNEPRTDSIIDLVMRGENKNDKKKN